MASRKVPGSPLSRRSKGKASKPSLSRPYRIGLVPHVPRVGVEDVEAPIVVEVADLAVLRLREVHRRVAEERGDVLVVGRVAVVRVGDIGTLEERDGPGAGDHLERERVARPGAGADRDQERGLRDRDRGAVDGGPDRDAHSYVVIAPDVHVLDGDLDVVPAEDDLVHAWIVRVVDLTEAAAAELDVLVHSLLRGE